jgi:two-component system, sensor histidine kinase and response regulator
LDTILIIEDDTSIREGITNFLQLENFTVFSAENGFEGLKIAKKVNPNLIISDIMMPLMDGYEFLANLRNEKDLCHIPILLLSAKSEKSMIREGMNLGADDYLTKPFTFDELLQAISTRLKRNEEIIQKSEEKFDKISSKIVSLMPHEFYTPLSSILGFSEILIQDHKNLQEQELVEMLQSMFNSGKRLQNLIENTLLYFWFTSNKNEIDENFEITTNPNQIIKEIVLDETKIFNRFNDFYFYLKNIKSLKIKEEHFIKIIKEPIINACKFSEKNTKIEIHSSINDEFYIISIRDFGRGILKEQLISIGEFIQFDKNYYNQQGQGLGLFVIKSLLKIYKGKLEIQSSGKEGTQLDIFIPIDTI